MSAGLSIAVAEEATVGQQVLLGKAEMPARLAALDDHKIGGAVKALCPAAQDELCPIYQCKDLYKEQRKWGITHEITSRVADRGVSNESVCDSVSGL